MRSRLSIAIGAGACLLSGAAIGQTSSTPSQTLTEPSGSGAYWTGDRMRAAKPRTPTVAPSTGNTARAFTAPTGKSEVGAGGRPLLATADIPKAQRVAPALEEFKDGVIPPTTNAANAAPEAIEFNGLPFTTQRVIPSDARVNYPYSTVGKLFFTEQGVGDFVCTAEVLRPRIVQTAGHCVAAPSQVPGVAHFFTNWVFVPGYDNGAAPFGMWRPTFVATSAEWLFSDGSVPNSADIGQFVIGDQSIFGAVHSIGEVTGYLGYRTNGIAGNHVTQLGYPCNLDSCERMQRNDAGNVQSGSANTAVIGSAMAGGSSGGPWVQDFGIAPVANPTLPGLLGNNYLIASTSYGPTGTQGFLGASILGQTFINMLNLTCGRGAGNCP